MQNVYFRFAGGPNRCKTKASKSILMFLTFVTASFAAMSQDRTVSGVVSDEDSSPLPGVTVVIRGTSDGAITDIDGKYIVEIPANIEKVTLEFSSIGFIKQTIAVGERTVIDVQMLSDVNELNEVIITAFGIEREKKALGYSATDLNGESVSTVKEANLVNSLQGKVAGLTITQTGSGLGGSSRILLRGIQNINPEGNNQPLIVVDGVPIDNTSSQQAGRWGGVDYGSPISDINPDDVENISILKGPNASALYGIRGGNGVILITTKTGAAREGIGVDVSSQTTVDIINENILPNWQNEYGQGSLGSLPVINGLPETSLTSIANWGPRMDGQLVRYPDGIVRPFVPQPNSFRDFYNVGKSFNNVVALSGGNETSTARLSLGYLDAKGIVPNSHLKRYNVNLRGTTKLGDKISLDAKINYINQVFDNRPNLSDIMENVANGLRLMPRNFPLSVLRNNFRNADLSHAGYASSAFVMNPYWAVNVHENQDQRNRVIASFALNYDILDWLKLRVGANQDLSNERRDLILPIGTTYQLGGSVKNSIFKSSEINSNFLLTGTRDINEDINISTSVGGNYRRNSGSSSIITGSDIAVPGIYRVQNTGTVTAIDDLKKQEIHSLYGFIDASYKNIVFLNATARNDWASTLPEENNSFFFPSVGLSFVVTDAFPINNDILTFAKVRASWAESADAADPYKLEPTVDLGIPNYLNVPLGTIPDDRPNSQLKSVTTESIEVGADLRFLDNRIGLDVTWYQAETRNQIIPITVSGASGFNTAIINAGLVKNNGIEFALNADILEINGLTWSASVNFSKNSNEVVELAEGVPVLLITEDRNVRIEARPGSAYGNIVGLDFQRDDQGRVLLDDATRIPLRSAELSVLGNVTPDWTGGFNTTVGYKGIKLSATIDVRQGGDIVSLTNMFGAAAGSYAPTLEGRAEWYASEAARVAAGTASADWTPTGGLVPDGVTSGGEVNTTPVDPQSYWGVNALTPFIYDASFIKLRELSISYAIPGSLLSKTPLTRANVSLVGRNLFYIHRNTDGFDPESSYNNSTGIGIESASVPTTRTIGFNVNFSF